MDSIVPLAPPLEMGQAERAEFQEYPKPKDSIPMNVEDAPASANKRPEVFRSTIQEVLFVLVATMSVAMPSFLQGATLVITSSIRRDLNMTAAELIWMTAASLSLGTGFTRNGITLDILNGVMGLACAATIPAAQGILRSIYDRPSKRKNYAFACFTSGNHLGFVFNAIFSGVATHIFDWRASFGLLSIIYLAVGITALIVTPTDDSVKSPFSALKTFDYVGAILIIAGIGLFTAGISLGPEAPHEWRTSYVLVFVIVGLCLIAAFVWWECRIEHPLMDMKTWLDREFSLLILILTLGFLSFPALFFFVALYLQEIFEYSALITAACFIPTAVSGIVVNLMAGRLLHRVSNKLLMAVGAAAFVISFLLIALQRQGISYWALTFLAMALVVVGIDLEFNVVNMYVISALDKTQQSIASSIFQTIIKLATTVGLGATAAIFCAVSNNQTQTGYYANDPFRPYGALSWFSMGLSVVSLALVPFLKVNTQGH